MKRNKRTEGERGEDSDATEGKGENGRCEGVTRGKSRGDATTGRTRRGRVNKTVPVRKEGRWERRRVHAERRERVIPERGGKE